MMARTRRRGGLRGILFLAVLAALAWLGISALRAGRTPELTVTPKIQAIGRSTPFAIRAESRGRGLTRLTVEVRQGDKTETVLDESWTAPPAGRPWARGHETHEATVPIGRESLAWLKQGSATVRVQAETAGSWLRSPDPATFELELPVRLAPPTLGVLSTQTYVRQGGCETVVYRVGEGAERHGVQAGEWFFPGYPKPGGQPGEQFALFAVPYDLGDVAKVRLVATDVVGNTAQVAFVDKFFPEAPSSDVIEVTDAFLEKVVAPILSQTPDLEDRGNLLDNYLQINRDLRRANAEELVKIAASSKPEFLWSRPFAPMVNAAVMAAFADRRTYRYQGREIDRQDHLGFDLASTQQDAVPSANDGTVVLARYMGIYGNTVIVDHGFGLMSLYGHLSSIAVSEGDQVTRGQMVGRTGVTGLAVGDHLHFTMLLQGLPVNPREWWDGHWIEDRLVRKLGSSLPFTP